VCYVENGRCSLVSRRGNVFTRFDALGEQVASALCRDVVSELGVDEAILDGEVIVADETGRPQFYDLLRRTRRPIYVAFDLLWFPASAGGDCTGSCRPDRRQSWRRCQSSGEGESSFI
jgi:ATP-dependent DNA ligase